MSTNSSSRLGAVRQIRSSSLFAVALALAGVSTALAFGATAASAAPTTDVNLNSAAAFAVLAGSTITNTGSTVVSGGIGLTPGSAITGFPPGIQTSGTPSVDTAVAVSAQTDLTAAYTDASTRTPASAIPADLGGSTLTAGVYQAPSTLAITGTLTLNGAGDSSSVFIIQVPSSLTTASGSKVVLENGAQSCHVYFQVTSSATLGTNSSFAGTLLAMTSITASTGASVDGRLLARNGAVTLDDNTITVPTCSAVAPTTTTSTTTSTTTTTTTVAPTTTTTVPPTTTTTTSPSGRPSSTTTTPVIPVGAPATGFGGMAGSSGSGVNMLALSALAALLGGGAAGYGLRRRRASVRGDDPRREG